MRRRKIIFVTGTDTGVGKTVLTGLLLYHLRQSPGRTLAMKPFCSGGLGDVRLLQSLQPGELSDAEMNPYYFAQPIAPLAAATKKHRPRLNDVVRRIKTMEKTCDQLLIEGSGGLLVPLGDGYTVADLIVKLDCKVIIAARNQLGTINHTLLTVQALKANKIKAKQIAIVLLNSHQPDLSASSNQTIISQLVRPISVYNLPHLGKTPLTTKKAPENYAKVKTILSNLARLHA